MMYDWPDVHTMFCMHTCRENNKPCEYANYNGYCQITAYIKQPKYVRIESIPLEQWTKSREE